jgi:anti-sigma factor (TIGR02949 family)
VLINCRRAEAALSAYIDGELAGDEMLAMRRHLDECPACAASLAAEKQVRSLLSSLPDAPCPPGLEDRIAQAVFCPTPKKFSWSNARLYGAVATAAAACAVAAFYLTSQRTDSPIGREPRLNQSMDVAFVDGRDSLGVYVPLVPVSHQTSQVEP